MILCAFSVRKENEESFVSFCQGLLKYTNGPQTEFYLQFTRWLRKETIHLNILYNILTIFIDLVVNIYGIGIILTLNGKAYVLF